MPLVARGVMGATGVPLGLLTMLALYAVILRRGTADVDAAHRNLVRGEQPAERTALTS